MKASEYSEAFLLDIMAEHTHIEGHKVDLYRRWFAVDPFDAFGREILPGMIIMKPDSSNQPYELLKVTHRKGDAIYVEGKRAKISQPGRCLIVTDSIPTRVVDQPAE